MKTGKQAQRHKGTLRTGGAATKGKKPRSRARPKPSIHAARGQKWELHTPFSLTARERDFETIEYMVAGAIEDGAETGKTGHQAILESVRRICEESLAKGGEEISALEGIALLATGYLMCVPIDKLKVLAKRYVSWPVVATTDPYWHLTTRKYLAAIELGADTIKARFARRAWTGAGVWRSIARLAVETMDRNRTTFQVKVFQVCAGGGPKHASFKPAPAWALKCAELPAFTEKSAPQWATLARLMIREECPHVAQYVDKRIVENLTRSLQGDRSGDVPPGIVRNKILDKIAGAILTISKVRPRATVT